MWIPTPIYERIPQFMLLIGVVFIASAIYLGFSYSMSYFYFGVGVSCCFWGLVVLVTRQHHRSAKRKDEPVHSDEAEQA